MGCFTFYYNFLDYTVTASSEDAQYPATNLKYYEYTRRHWRSTSTALQSIDITSNPGWEMIAVFLNDVNFTSVIFNDEIAQSFPFTIVEDKRTGRYKLLAAIRTTTNLLKIVIPNQPTTDGKSYFRIGSVIVPLSQFILPENPIYPYSYTADEAVKTVDAESGRFWDVTIGPQIWEGNFGFEIRKENENDMWMLNSTLTKSTLCIFYEGLDDTSKAYLCRRRTPIEVQWNNFPTRTIQAITFREVY